MFAFDATEHQYIDTERGEILPHITGMLEQAGLIDSRWYTAESCERGTQVHRLTTDWDLGAIEDLASVTSRYKPYLLGHVSAMAIIKPEWSSIEEPVTHEIYRFGGRPDRVGRVYGLQSVLEVKSGGKEKAHAIQTALQAILVAPLLNLPAEAIQRFALYLTPKGRFQLEQFPNQADFTEAKRIIRLCYS